jgi:signal recognition particle subunit SRP54
MFNDLSERFQEIFKKLRGHGVLTENNISEAMREVRQALLAADVNFKIAKGFVQSVAQKAVGQEVLKHVTPGQQVIKIVHDELAVLMGSEQAMLNLEGELPAVILMAGLQGSGKTTTAAKLARLLQGKGRHPMLVAADLQRPAAVEQLVTLGRQLDVPVHADARGTPLQVCREGVEAARRGGRDVVILDTAGRLHVDEELMEEVSQIARSLKPREILLVCDAMTGQDAVTSAKAFNDRLEITGIILTKLDGDARGGAALSIRAVTGKPIKFVGSGEKLDRLEPFRPDRMASRILGMGDIVSLVEKAQETIDQDKAQKMEERLLKAQFTFEDLLEQMKQVQKMGSFRDLLSMLPGVGSQLKNADFDEKQIKRTEAIMLSMTPKERRHPEIIDGGRKKRIAGGSGTSPEEVNTLLKQFQQMKKMMKQMGKMGKRGFGKGKLPMPGLPF